MEVYWFQSCFSNSSWWQFHTVQIEDLDTKIQRMNLANLLEWPPPKARSVHIIKKFLKKIITYLRSGNLQTPLEACLTAEGGNKVVDEPD